MKIDSRKFWLVKHPVSNHYEESQADVKKLARMANLRIRDSKFPVADEFLEKNPPKLTEKGAAKSEPKAKKVKEKTETNAEANSDE